MCNSLFFFLDENNEWKKNYEKINYQLNGDELTLVLNKFSNEKVIYKIVYNSSPNKFIEEITSSGFNIDTSSAIWKIK